MTVEFAWQHPLSLEKPDFSNLKTFVISSDEAFVIKHFAAPGQYWCWSQNIKNLQQHPSCCSLRPRAAPALTGVMEMDPGSLLHRARSRSSLPKIAAQQGFFQNKELFSHRSLCLPASRYFIVAVNSTETLLKLERQSNLYSSSLQGSPYNMHLIRLYNGLKPKKLADKALWPVPAACKVNG